MLYNWIIIWYVKSKIYTVARTCFIDPSQIGGIDCGVFTGIGAEICASGQHPSIIIDTSEIGNWNTDLKHCHQ